MISGELTFENNNYIYIYIYAKKMHDMIHSYTMSNMLLCIILASTSIISFSINEQTLRFPLHILCFIG